MPLWVLKNSNADLVVKHLLQILGSTTGLVVGGDGRVALELSPSGPANLLLRLASSPVNIAIRGEDAEYSTDPAANNRLKNSGGATVFDMFPGTSVVEVVYDVTACSGKGYWVEGAEGARGRTWASRISW